MRRFQQGSPAVAVIRRAAHSNGMHECATEADVRRDADIRVRIAIERACILTASAGTWSGACEFRRAFAISQATRRAVEFNREYPRVTGRQPVRARPSGRRRCREHVPHQEHRARFSVDIRPPKRLAALCFSTVSVGVPSRLLRGLPRRRRSMNRACASDRPISPDVDIRLAKPVEALCISTVSAKRKSRSMRIPARISARRTHSRPCVFER